MFSNDQTGVPSPFISTANLLVWVFRMALKGADESTCISIMDTSKLDSKAIYHVPPFYKGMIRIKTMCQGCLADTFVTQLSKRSDASSKAASITKDPTNSESSCHIVFMSVNSQLCSLIWDRIPGSAIVNTVSLQDIVAFAESNKAVKRVLRIDKLTSAKSSATEITKTLKQDNIRMDGPTAAAIAQIVIFLGLDHMSSTDTLSRAVHEIVQGWALVADGQSQEEWKHFVQVFVDKSDFAHVASHVRKLQQA